MPSEEDVFEGFWKWAIAPSIKRCQDELEINFSQCTGLTHHQDDKYKVILKRALNEKQCWLEQEYLPDDPNPTLDFHKIGAILCRCIIGNKYFDYDVKQANIIQRNRNKHTIDHADQIKWEINNIYINYKLAFLVAAGVAFSDLLFRVEVRIDTLQNELKKLNKEHLTKCDKIRTEIEIIRSTGGESCSQEYKDLTKKLEKANLEHDSKKQMITYEIDSLLRFMNDLQKAHSLSPYRSSKKHDDFATSVIIALAKTDLLMRDFDYLFMASMLFQWQEYTKLCMLPPNVDCCF